MRLLKVPRSGPVTALALSIDGSLVTATDGVLKVWDSHQLAMVANLPSFKQKDLEKITPRSCSEAQKGNRITCLKVVNDWIVSGDAEGRVYKTSLKTFESELLFEHSQKQINDISSRGDLLLFATLNKIMTYDLQQEKQLAYIPARTDIRSVCVDPSGSYLTTVGLNKNVSVYQIHVVEGEFLYKKITVASLTIAQISDICRISWSPSGDRFAVPNSILDLHTKSIGMISRSNWKSELSLVGQEATSVKFCPKLFNNGEKNYNIIASSGVDKAITVWNTTFQRPLFTAVDVSSETINDIEWSQDGLTMFVAGDSIVVFVFEEPELGKPISQEALDEIISKLKVPEPLQIKHKDTPVTPAIPHVPKVQEQQAVEGTPPVEAELIEKKLQPALEPEKHIITKHGKKRLAPTLVSANGKSTNQLISQLNVSTEPSQSTMEFDTPSYNVPKDLKRREESEIPESDQPPKKKRELEPVEFIGNIAVNPSTAFSKIRISTPKIRSSFTLESPDDSSLSLEIKNGSGTEQRPTKVTLLKNKIKQVFADFIPKLVCLATGGEGYFWAVSTVEGVLYLYSDCGRRLLPPIVLGTPLSFLESKGKYLLAVTSIGELYAWDVEAKKALFEPAQLYPLLARSSAELLTRAENLTMCSISSSGVPIVTISNGNGYLFDRDMETWSLISDSWWAFGSQYWDSRNVNANGSLITMLEKKTNDEIVRRGRAKFLQKMAKTMLMKEGYENLEKTISLAHLENRILIASKLNESIEFKTHLIIYCKRISEMGFKARLLEIFEELLGPQSDNTTQWEPKVVGLDKHELLKELIFACASIRNAQRILVQFATAMNILDQVSF
jgi:protein HIRA/HIR1